MEPHDDAIYAGREPRHPGMTKTAALVYGKIPPDASADERDTLIQADAMRASLGRLGWATVDVPVTLDLSAASAALRAASPAIVFNLVEGLEGTGRLIALVPSLLDSLGIPYTGASAEAIFLTSNKLLGKDILKKAGIRTPPWITAGDAAAGERPEFPPPFIIKYAWEHASIGLDDQAVCGSADVLAARLAERAKGMGGRGVYAEPYIEGREFNLSLIGGGPRGPENLPPAEIRFIDFPPDRPKVVGYRAKWAEDSYEFTHTPRSFEFSPQDAPLLEKLMKISRECWRAFDLRGYARVDFRVDGAGEPWVLEINANPCIAPDSGFIAAAAQAGLDVDGVVRRIIQDTLGKDTL